MTRRLKSHYAAVIRTAHAGIKASPGGVETLAEATGRNAQVLRNTFAPNDPDTAPSLEVFLDAISICGLDATVNAVAGLVDMAAVRVPTGASRTAGEPAFVSVAKELGDVLQAGGIALADGRISVRERADLIPEINEAIAELVAWRAVLMGA